MKGRGFAARETVDEAAAAVVGLSAAALGEALES